jgi:hypothetical protein
MPESNFRYFKQKKKVIKDDQTLKHRNGQVKESEPGNQTQALAPPHSEKPYY